jgi:hypothetical protein
MRLNGPASPCAANDFLADHVELLCHSFHHWTGRTLINPCDNRVERARALFESPFAVVSHNTADDPLFNYANLKAMELFEMDWATITNLPSRLSAEPVNQATRLQSLRQVAEKGYVDGYSGIRISASGRRFRIDDVTIWNVLDADGNGAGQAAMFANWLFV